MLEIPDRRDRQTRMEESTTSMETRAPVMAPMPVPRKRPLSVASPISPPVTAPRNSPAMAKMKVMTPRKTLCIILLPPAVLASDASDTFEPLRGAAWKKAPDGSISLFPSSAHVHLDRSIDHTTRRRANFGMEMAAPAVVNFGMEKLE